MSMNKAKAMNKTFERNMVPKADLKRNNLMSIRKGFAEDESIEHGAATPDQMFEDLDFDKVMRGA